MAVRDVERYAPAPRLPHLDEPEVCPPVQDWVDDEFGSWVTRHEKEVRNLVCSSTRYQDEVFCDM